MRKIFSLINKLLEKFKITRNIIRNSSYRKFAAIFGISIFFGGFFPGLANGDFQGFILRNSNRKIIESKNDFNSTQNEVPKTETKNTEQQKPESQVAVTNKPIPVPTVKPAPTPSPVSKPVAPKPVPKPQPAPQQVKPTPSTAPIPVPISNQFIDLVNQIRRENGLGPVKYSNLLNQAALNKSKDMAAKNYFAHTTPEGKSDFEFIKEVGYKFSAAGSNIAKGNFGGDKGVFDAWMNSSGHKANILASYGQEIGFGVYNGYYTMFIAKKI